MDSRFWGAAGRLWDWLIPALICLDPMAAAYYYAIPNEELPLVEYSRSTRRDGPIIQVPLAPAKEGFGVKEATARAGD